MYRIRLTGVYTGAVFTLTPRYTAEGAQRAMARMQLAKPSSYCHREIVNSRGQVVTV